MTEKTPVTHAHQIRLNSTSEQMVYFKKAAGVRRFVYNWGLNEWNRQYEAGLKPSIMAIKKQFNAIKKEQFPWIYEVTKCAVEGALMDLVTAFKNFFAGKAKYPRFKSKKRTRDGFYVANDRFTVGDHWIKPPHIGVVNMAETLRFEGKIMSARFSRTADWWFVSLTVEHPPIAPEPHKAWAVGIDLGIHQVATLSDGTVLENQKYLRAVLKKLKRLQQAVNRKIKGSKNYEKAARQVTRLHYRIACFREDILQKFTTAVLEKYAVIAIEDLNVRGMLKNHRLALALSEVGLGRFCTLLKEKRLGSGKKSWKSGGFSPLANAATSVVRSNRRFRCLNGHIVAKVVV